MSLYLFRHNRGLIRRWYRKNFHKEWEVVEHGLYFFQEFADIYNNSINDIETADLFFKDFMGLFAVYFNRGLRCKAIAE